MAYKETIAEYIPQFVEELTKQLAEDNQKWGDTWKKRDLLDQEDRIFNKIQDYRDQYENAFKRVPWLKIAGLALIGWIREREAGK